MRSCGSQTDTISEDRMSNRIEKTLEIIYRLEGRDCILCGKRNTEVHHIIEKSKVNEKARNVIECKPELMTKLCPQCHRGIDGAHSLMRTRQRIFDHKVIMYGLDGMKRALNSVNMQLKIKLTWEGLGYEIDA